MPVTISLRDANQRFARLVRAVQGGAEYVITRRGEPVARLVPASPARRTLSAEQKAALARTLARADAGWCGADEPFDRAALHER